MPPPKRATLRDAISERLDREPPPYLPMPHDVGAERRLPKLGPREWEEYLQRRARHSLFEPDYEQGFGRPAPEIADAAWLMVSGPGRGAPSFKKLVPRHGWLTADEREALKGTAKQALVLVLDRMVGAGAAGTTITLNYVFDTLAERYSDHFRASPTRVVRDMTVERAKSCRRDLLLDGVHLKELWGIAVGHWSSQKKGGNPLYWVERIPRAGYRVFLKEQFQVLGDWNAIVEEDPGYERWRRREFGLLLAHQEPLPRDPEREVAAERSYNEVNVGPRTENVLRLQQEARLIFDSRAFREDQRRLAETQVALRSRLEIEYGVDLGLSSVKPKVRNGTAASGQGRQRSRRKRELWSARDKDLFYRSIDVGLRSKATSGRADLEAKCEKELQSNAAKWKDHVRRYREWRRERRGVEGDAAVEDVVRAWAVTQKWRDRARELLARYDRLRTHATFYEHTYQQAVEYEYRRLVGRAAQVARPKGVEGLVVRSGFYKLVNRRYQPAHLWPAYVTTKNMLPDEARLLDEETFESWRKRWFKAEDPETGKAQRLAGLDISSSQTQIIALLVSSDRLLEVMATTGKSIKKLLAEWAWEKHRDPDSKFELRAGYKGAEDERLQELVKNLWMRIFYGSPLYEVVWDHWDDPIRYGGAWRSQSCAEELLTAQPGYADMKRFLDACRRMAEVAFERDPCDGVRLRDPFDESEVRWNPVARVEWNLRSESQRLTLSLPGRFKRKKIELADPNERGDYPVDLPALRNMVAPCLVHMLDAYFSSLVMERLAAQGIRDFAAIHDCWVVPERVRVLGGISSGREVLEEVLDDAAGEWYQGLGPVYDNLLGYLSGDKTFGSFVRRIRDLWAERAQSGYRPKFLRRPS